MYALSTTLLLASATALASASPKPVVVPIQRREPLYKSLSRRSSPEAATLENDFTHGLYYANVSVGTPGQTIQLQVDTGSADVWMFSPTACSEVKCNGGSFNSKSSSTYQVYNELGPFEINYDTPGSVVKGNYFTDDLTVGGIHLTDQIMAVANEAKETFRGIMGISFPSQEAIYSETNYTKDYKNFPVRMYEEGIVPSSAYSLYLDDLGASTGSIIFGGYDTKKFSGPLTVLDIVVGPSGLRNSMAVSWTYLGLTGSQGSTTLVSNSTFPLTGILDSGTTLTLLPSEALQPVVEYFGAIYDKKTQEYFVDCNIANWKGTLDFGFGGGAGIIQVPFAELAVPIKAGNATIIQGKPICKFGLGESINGDNLLGDTFLRSAYVVYDLQALQIGIAQTVYNSQESDVQPIAAGTNLVSILGSNAKAATAITAVPTHARSNSTMRYNTAATRTSSISGITTSLPISTTVTETPNPAITGGAPASSTSSKAAAAAATDVAGARGVMAGGSLLALLMGALL